MINEQKKHELAKKAADYWTDMLSHISYDNGEESQRGILSLFAALTQKSDTFTDEQKDVFHNFIETQIIDSAKSNITMGCDYSPYGLLSDAYKTSGIPSTLCSFKHDMEIDLTNGTITIWPGYGQPGRNL